MTASTQITKIELNAVIVAIADGSPQVLLDDQMSLPSGSFSSVHKTLEQGLREWASAKGGQPLGYVEQLYTFADRDRLEKGQRLVSIGYLALVRAAATLADADWSNWYKHFPWEDHREGVPEILTTLVYPGLEAWKDEAAEASLQAVRAQRTAFAFPKGRSHWNEELVLQRYELLWEAGLVGEAHAKGNQGNQFGLPMAHDHRRILATAIARLRAKIKYRPVVFELMPDTFTLLQLQTTVEALAGLRLHKQNFRRLIEGQGLVEETGAMTRGESGRPAKLFAFRREVLLERAAAGTKLPRSS